MKSFVLNAFIIRKEHWDEDESVNYNVVFQHGELPPELIQESISFFTHEYESLEDAVDLLQMYGWEEKQMFEHFN